MEAYLDNAATTRVFPEVREKMVRVMEEDFGNPSSKHTKGMDAEKYIRETKEILAKDLKCTPGEIIFTSGGTESNNTALIGGAYANRRAGKHIITTRIEHASVHEPLAFLEELGYQVTYLPVDKNGQVSPSELEKALTEETILVSIMFVNNEIGAVEDVKTLSEIVHSYNPKILFHVDAIQAYGKYHIVPKRLGIDLMSVSGHKLHGPKGVGFLYMRDKAKVRPLIYGGGQQKGFRSGTENVPGIAGLAKAAEMLYSRFDEDHARLCACKRRFIEGVRELDQVTVNGLLPDAPYGEGTAAHIVSVSFAGVRSEVLLHALEDKGIYVSAGSACSAHKPQPSAALKAIGVDKSLLDSTIRFSFSVFTTEEEIDVCLRALYNIVPMLRRYSRR